MIGRVIESYAKRFGYGVVRDFTGHGIGTVVPLRPGRPALRRRRATTTMIEPGMTFTIEPMLNLGTHEWDMWDDGWTVVTKDRRRTRAVRAHPPGHRHRRRDPHPALTASPGRSATPRPATAQVRSARDPGEGSPCQHDHPLGIDIGGSGIKGAPVDLDERRLRRGPAAHRDPGRSTPKAVAEVVKEIAEHFADDTGDAPIGVTVPAVVTHGVVRTAANIDQAWIGTDAEKLLSDELGRAVLVVNDADAAGVAEVHYGAARDHDGPGPDDHAGHRHRLRPAQPTASWCPTPSSATSRSTATTPRPGPPRAPARTRTCPGSSGRSGCSGYYSHVENLLWPDLFVVGGGVSKKADKFLPLLHLRAPIVPAQLQNAAGIVGAAWLAVDRARD